MPEIEIDINKAEQVFKSMQADRNRNFPQMTKEERLIDDRRLMEAVLAGARAYELKRLRRKGLKPQRSQAACGHSGRLDLI